MKDGTWQDIGTGNTKKYKQIHWEALQPSECLDDWLRRLKVPGGWLVKPNTRDAHTITFVPDSTHEWLKEASYE